MPPGFYITTAAYRRFLTEHGLQERILEDASAATPDQPATLEEAFNQIEKLFAQTAMPDDIAEDIRRAYAGIGEGDVPVAVRSSATDEDLPEMSFAGQQETYLNVCGSEAVLEAVKKCWASLWAARAIGYRASHNIAPQDVSLSVVVQVLVSADAAGILFTANPLTRARSQMMINTVWGLGEANVSGAVTPETLKVEKATGRIVSRVTADKQSMTVRAETGTREAPVPDFQKKKAVLTDAQAAELAKLGAAMHHATQNGRPRPRGWWTRNC